MQVHFSFGPGESETQTQRQIMRRLTQRTAKLLRIKVLAQGAISVPGISHVGAGVPFTVLLPRRYVYCLITNTIKTLV